MNAFGQITVGGREYPAFFKKAALDPVMAAPYVPK